MCVFLFFLFVFFKQKTAYEMLISDWSSDVCSSDLPDRRAAPLAASAAEIGLQAGAATLPAIRVWKAGIGGGKAIPAHFEPRKPAAGGEDIVREYGAVAQRPGGARGADRFRGALRAVSGRGAGRGRGGHYVVITEGA